METNKMCQSCGMPMKKDPAGGGTNADGTKTQQYCSYCYRNGKFTWEGKVEDFQEHCKKMMIEGGHSRFISWLFTRGMKRLPRWKNSN
ncbi:MAG: zinc ribbon domain-containing protein [Bacteroidia bacterium]